MKTLAILVFGLVLGVQGLADLPHRARGGTLWKEMQQQGRFVEPHNVSATPMYLTQELDHTNKDQGTFEQKYFEDKSFWASHRAPLFVYIGGEGPLGGIPGGWVYNLAKQFGAAILAAEARFYGDSVPLEDGVTKNFTVEALQFLTVENHLEDLSLVIQNWRATNSHVGSVGIFGGSYAGALSAWFRESYPDIANFSLSSSGVVHPQIAYPEFDEHIYNVLNTYNKTCLTTLQQTMTAYSTAFQNGGAQEQAARNSFPGNTPALDTDFFYMIADALSMSIQYNTGTDLCAAVSPGTSDELMNNFGAFVAKRFGTDFSADCFYDTDCLQNDPARWQPTSRAWRAQKCWQVGWLQDAPAANSIRPAKLTLAALQQQCADVFGGAAPAQPDAAGLNAKYGGFTPNTNRVVASQFGADPWLPVGVQTSRQDYPRLYAPGFDIGHCTDLHSPSDSDPEALTKLRQAEVAYIQSWL